MAPPTWSMWAWVMTICFTCSLCWRTMARMSSMSSPGSMTMASCVVSSPMIEQLHCSGPTGRILWIILRFSLRPRQFTTAEGLGGGGERRLQRPPANDCTYNVSRETFCAGIYVHRQLYIYPVSYTHLTLPTNREV